MKKAGTNASWFVTPATKFCRKKTMTFATMSRRTHGVTGKLLRRGRARRLKLHRAGFARTSGRGRRPSLSYMPSRVSTLAQTLRGSAILRIAGEVRELAKTGKPILDLTVGDFSSKQFPIPRELEDGVVDALRAGESTYPPS